MPFRFATSERFLAQMVDLPGVRVGLLSGQPLEQLPPSLRAGLSGHWRIEDPFDPRQIVAGCRGLAKQLGGLDGLHGVLEQLQVPLAEAREALGLPGLSVDSARGFRDKALMKERLRAAGLPCAAHCLAESADEARVFFSQLPGPCVLKPPAGAGAKDTFRVDDGEQLEQALRAFPPSRRRPLLLEEFVQGHEHSFDAACRDGELLWHSVSRYLPSPLTVLENDWIQWCVLLPREIDGPELDDIRAAAAKALQVLGMDTGLAHMEWFRREDGSLAISEVGARPPGAQFTSLMSWAHDHDMYRAWSRLVALNEFDPPERRHAVGAAYLRAQGRGRVTNVRGLSRIQAELGDLIVEAKLPSRGQAPSSSYEGDGHVVLRHHDTETLEKALLRVVQLVRVELSPAADSSAQG